MVITVFERDKKLNRELMMPLTFQFNEYHSDEVTNININISKYVRKR